MSCELIDEKDMITFNDIQMTYRHFKLLIKESGTKWDFDDTLDNNNPQKFKQHFDKFAHIWNKFG